MGEMSRKTMPATVDKLNPATMKVIAPIMARIIPMMNRTLTILIVMNSEKEKSNRVEKKELLFSMFTSWKYLHQDWTDLSRIK